jgi:hypothetical protein
VEELREEDENEQSNVRYYVEELRNPIVVDANG